MCEPRSPTRSEHVLGICLSVLVAFIWAGSSEMIQLILKPENYDKPYFFTYLTTCHFGILLLGFSSRKWREKIRDPSYSTADEQSQTSPSWNVRDHMAVAAIIYPLYFSANYIFNAGLHRTSVSSSSTISNLSALFTLGIGVITGDEKFSPGKLIATILTFLGAGLILEVDIKSRHLVGDLLSIASAFLFAVYTTTLKKKAPEHKAVETGMLFGFVGLFAIITGWLPLLILHVTGIETFVWPSWHVLAMLCMNALIGTVLSDYLYAKAVVLTTALTVNITLSFSVPLSVLFDRVFHSARPPHLYVFGIIFVIVSIIIVNVELKQESTPKLESKKHRADRSDAKKQALNGEQNEA